VILHLDHSLYGVLETGQNVTYPVAEKVQPLHKI
jgi:hypothetical protein